MKKRILPFVLSIFALGMGFSLGKARAAAAEAVPTAKPTEAPQAPAAHLTRKEMMDKLQVTKAQKALLRQNRAAYRKQIALIEGQFKVKKVELESEIEKPEPDQEKIDQLTTEIGTLLAKKYSAQIKAELEIEKKILTPQQVEQLKALQGREVFVPNDIF
jgi:Spy/CpxP family protein refolding chaperone